MPAIIVPGAIKRNVYLFSDDHTEKRDTHLPDVEWVDDEITAEREARIAADNVLQANIDAEETRAKAAETTLQANIDAEETRAKAAEATKENLSNKIASTGTYVSDDTHYATTATVDQRIAEVSPPEVKWATYDDTDFWTIEEWMDDGLLVLCNYSDHIYVATWKDTQTVNFASLLSDQTFADAYHLTCNSRWGWEDGVTNLEVMNNKQTSDTSWFSNDALYPTTAAVEDYVSKHTVHVFVRGGDEVLADVQAAFDAGEVCVCYDEDEDIYMQLINLSDWQASFAAVDSSHWLYNTAAWEDEWDDCWTNHLLLENHVNVSTETWYSSDNYIPSNKAVENYVAAHSGCKVQVAEYGVTTFATIKSWYDAGNEVICKYGDHLYHLGTCLAFRAVFAAVPNNNAANQNLTSDNLIVTSSGWSTLQQSIETMNHRVDTYASWPASGSTNYPTTTAVEGYVAAHAPSGVEWATYGTTTYSQIKSWNDAGKPVFLKYTTSGPVDFIMKLTIVTPGGAFFCGVQGGSVYAAEVNPGNQWAYNTSALQNSALVHEYETWDETDDYSYPSLASVSNYVAAHAGSDVVWATYGTTTSAQLETWLTDNKIVLLKYSSNSQIMRLDYRTSSTEHFFHSVYTYGAGTLPRIYEVKCSNNSWSNSTIYLQTSSNMMKSTATWSSSDSQYPTAKAIENYVANHGGPIKIASTSNTALEIYDWQQAGNAVFLKESGDLYALQYVNNTNAYFVQLYVPDANTDPQVYWKAVSGNNWTGGNFYLQKKLNTLESTNNKLLSTYTWASDDTKYPTTQAVADYVAAHAGGDIYTIEGDGTIFFPVTSLDWDDNNLRWKLTHYPSTGTDPVYSPRTNFRMLKNGATFAFNSNHWLNIKPFTTSGDRTYAAGSNVLTPTTTWGTTSAATSPNGSKIGVCFYMSDGTATNHNSNIGIYGKISPNTVVSDWHALDNFFWIELYDKTVSQTVPVCRKLMRFAPSLVGDFDVTGQQFNWITALKNNCPNKIYMKATNGTNWYNGTVLKYTNTNEAGNCHYFNGLAYNSTDGKYYIVRYSRQSSTGSYTASKITTT